MQFTLRDVLSGGDRRSIGRSDKVVREVLAGARPFADLVAAMRDADPIVRMRAADAAEKVSRENPPLLKSHKRALLALADAAEQQEVQWHAAQILPRLDLSAREVSLARAILTRYLRAAKSNIVRVMSLQAFADLAVREKIGRADAARIITAFMERLGTPSVLARGKKLLRELKSSVE